MNLFCAHEKDYIRDRETRRYNTSCIVKAIGVVDGCVVMKQEFGYTDHESANEHRKSLNTLVRPMIEPTNFDSWRLVWT